MKDKNVVTEFEENKLPVIVNKANLLPVVIIEKELALKGIKEKNNINKRSNVGNVIWNFIKKALFLFAKLIRLCVIAIAKTVGFIVISAIIIISTTIITKNIINFYCNKDKTTTDHSSYSIFNVYLVKKDSPTIVHSYILLVESIILLKG